MSFKRVFDRPPPGPFVETVGAVERVNLENVTMRSPTRRRIGRLDTLF